MGTWFEDVIIFIFSYGWFFGLLPLIIGIIGAVFFSYNYSAPIVLKAPPPTSSSLKAPAASPKALNSTSVAP